VQKKPRIRLEPNESRSVFPLLLCFRHFIFAPSPARQPFFNWISADERIATARGGGGGLALWKRDLDMEARNAADPAAF
jgi:hypothetical protein